MQFIDLKIQQERIRPQIDAAIKKVLDHGKYIMGPEVYELEQQLAEFVGSKHCLSCSSGTDALLMGLMAYGVGPGDAVFTTPFTFIATAEVINLVGAIPIFVDIDPDTYNIDPGKIEQAVRRIKAEGQLKPRGIIPVDLFGLPADYDAIMPIAEKHGLFVLQDSAQAFGAQYKGKTCPTHGHIGATSFFPAKPLGCYGDGGAVFTDSDALADVIRSVRVHGQGADKYNNIRTGINGRIDTIQAAILLEKLKVYPEEIERRQQVAARYRKYLTPNTSDLKLPTIPKGSLSVYAQFCLESGHRKRIQSKLQDNGIPTAVYYPRPLHLSDAYLYLGYKQGDFSETEKVSQRIFALPMHPYLSEEDQMMIIESMQV